MEFFNFTKNSHPGPSWVAGKTRKLPTDLDRISGSPFPLNHNQLIWDICPNKSSFIVWLPKSTGFLSIDLHHLQSGSALQSTHPMTIHHQNLRVFPPEPFNHPLKIPCPNNACDFFGGGVALRGIHLNSYESSFVSKATGPQDKDRQQRFLTMLHQLGIGTGFRS